MLGHFSKEALNAFASAHNLDAGNQDFSEGVFDFKVCQKPDGRHYGIPDQDQCQKPNKEVKSAPDKGILGIFPGKKINFDTALKQGQKKTAVKKDELDIETRFKKNDRISKDLRRAAGEYAQGFVQIGLKSAKSGEWGRVASLNNLLAAFKIISDRDFQANAGMMKKKALSNGSPSEFVREMAKYIPADKKAKGEALLKYGLRAMETGTEAATWDEQRKTWVVNSKFKPERPNNTKSSTVSKPAPKKQWSKQETVDQYKAFLRMASANGQSSLSATDSAYRMLKAAKFDPSLMSNTDRMEARREVLGK
jgi:hypothetical protein